MKRLLIGGLAVLVLGCTYNIQKTPEAAKRFCDDTELQYIMCKSNNNPNDCKAIYEMRLQQYKMRYSDLGIPCAKE